jgi:hypothetical protein
MLAQMDDLVQFYRGDYSRVSERFEHLHVEPCLRAVPWSFQECLDWVFPQDADERFNLVWSPRGLVWLCLLSCKPFLRLAQLQVRDVRRGVPHDRRIHDCPLRPYLFDGVAGALMFWDSAQASAPSIDFFSRSQHQLLATLEHFAAVVSELPQGGMLLDGQTSRHRAILKMIRDLSRELRQSRLVYRGDTGQRLPAAPFFDAHPDIRALTIRTVQMMFEDFRAFGPDNSEFPREAIYHALAEILGPLGVHNTHGKAFKAAGIKRLLVRHPPPPGMYPRDDDCDT